MYFIHFIQYIRPRLLLRPPPVSGTGEQALATVSRVRAAKTELIFAISSALVLLEVLLVSRSTAPHTK